MERLRVFMTLAETKNFTRAAERLFVSHSTVSRSLSALEEELGVRLFDRDNHVVGLTAAGEKLRERAQELLDLADEIEAEVQKSGSEQP